MCGVNSVCCFCVHISNQVCIDFTGFVFFSHRTLEYLRGFQDTPFRHGPFFLFCDVLLQENSVAAEYFTIEMFTIGYSITIFFFLLILPGYISGGKSNEL